MNDMFDSLLLSSIGEAAYSLVSETARQGPQAGQRISHYRLLEPVGEGGMGIVFKAEDEKLGRFVALKFLTPPAGLGQELTQTLESEAQAASALNHPSICTIHDFIEHGEQRCIVMEYLEGETLKDRLVGGPLSESEALRITLAVASALEAAHKKNIIHCDVKPANIFLTTGGAVKVLDFGIARLKRGGAQAAGAGVDGLAAGTQAYMSPEQARGEQLDQRTDIFSLGRVFQNMLSSPTWRIARVIEKMTRHDPAERLQNIDEVTAGLKRVEKRLASRSKVRVVSLVAALALLGGLAVLWRASRPAPLAERDWILIGDFENRTNDPSLNDVLKDAVAVQIGQSPYVNVLPAQRVHEQLQLMRRPPDQHLTPDVAREICERAGIKAFLSGSIATVGSHYLVRLDAENARTGEYITQQAIDVDSKENVLKSIDRAAGAVRKSLGEAYATIERFDVPSESATTSSFEALRLFREGEAQMAQGTGAAAKAVPFFEEAISLDADFALAYARLADAYTNMRETKLAADAAREAFSRRSRVSERERWRIESRYYAEVTGETSKAMTALELWSQTYPQDPAPSNALMAHYKDLGQLEKAAEAGERAVQLDPSSALYRSNLCGAYLRLTALARAEDVCQAAVRDKLDNSTTHRFLETIALMTNDEKGIHREEEWRTKRTSDYANEEFKASMAGFGGNLREAARLYPEAIRLAELAGLNDRAAEYRSRFALLEAYFGQSREAGGIARQLLTSHAERVVRADAILALAIAGDGDTLKQIDEFSKDFPDDEYVHRLWIPMARGILALQIGKPSDAIQDLRLLRTYDRGDNALLRSSYYLGAAELAVGSGAEARAAFQNVVDNEGVIPTLPLYALGQLGMARANAMEGKRPEALAAYGKFFDLWKNADPDLPIMKTARAEYAKLRTAS